MARVVRREDGLRGLRHRPPERGQEPRLDEDLESVTGAEHGLARLDELRQVRSELAPQSSGEDRPGANVVPRREPAGDHEEVEVLEFSLHFGRRVSSQLFQVNLLGPGPEMAEEGDGLVLAVRPFDQQDGHPNVRALHATTT